MSSIMWATTSVSVSLPNECPPSTSFFFRSAQFSRMPLCTTTMSPVQSTWGWALPELGAPWVAQRVWPMPEAARPGASAATSDLRSAIRPACLMTLSPSPWLRAIPAES